MKVFVDCKMANGKHIHRQRDVFVLITWWRLLCNSSITIHHKLKHLCSQLCMLWFVSERWKGIAINAEWEREQMALPIKMRLKGKIFNFLFDPVIKCWSWWSFVSLICWSVITVVMSIIHQRRLLGYHECVHDYYASDCGIVSNVYGRRQYWAFVCLIVAQFVRFWLVTREYFW